MSLRILGFLAASIGAIAGLTAGVGVVTLQQWLPPHMPMVYLGAVLLGALVVLGAGWVYVTREELSTGLGAGGASVEERSLQRLVMIVSQVVLGLFAVALAGLWNVEQVRARAVPLVAESHVRLELPLRDPSTAVRLAACEEFFRRGWTFRSRGALASALNAHPDVVKSCLDTAAKNDWKGVISLAEMLGDGWMSEMLTAGPIATPRLCEVVPLLPAIDDFAGREPELRLLTCATASSSDDMRTCCARGLVARGELLDVLGSPEEFATVAPDSVFAELVQYGYRPLGLPQTRQRVATALGTDDETVRRWVAQLGCAKLDPTTAQPDLIRGFLPLVESRACGVPAEEQLEYTRPGVWVRLCGEILNAPKDHPVERTVCEAVVATRRDAAMQEANLRVHEAIRAMFLRNDADFITQGLSNADAYFGEEAESFRKGGKGKGKPSGFYYGDRPGERSAVEAMRLTSLSQPTCKKLVFGQFSEGLKGLSEAQTIESYDCERYDEDLSLEEYQRTHRIGKSSDVSTFENPFEAMRHDAMKKHGSAGAAATEAAAKRFDDAFKGK